MTELARAIVRLADEGVPVLAIARGLAVPSGDVYETIREALDEGRLVTHPPDDWRPGSAREERAIGRDPVAGRRLDDREREARLAALFGLTPHEARVLSALLVRPIATRAALHQALCADPASDCLEKMVDVYVHKLRRKIGPNGFPVRTLRGVGYALEEGSRRRLFGLLAATNPLLARAGLVVADDGTVRAPAGGEG